jgi:AcrR family transcriptional regulator
MRIVTAALVLFSEHGVSGTSLQMIADAIGVTKAAVYHQFRTKEAIVVAAVGRSVGRVRAPRTRPTPPDTTHVRWKDC